MSDGPYRSLPMSRSWKRLAEFAQNQNFEPADICNAALVAVMRDWRANVPAALLAGMRSAFLVQQGNLFAERHAERWRDLGRMTGGRGFARLFVDCAGAVLDAGGTGESGFIQAATNAVLARVSRGIRQVEEHYYRESTTALAKNVRARLEDAIRGADVHALARDLLKVTPRPTQLRPFKHHDLDDGVPL